MRGERNHARLAGTFVREVRTADGWELAHLGRYPAMVAGTGSVEGELWSVPAAALRMLDEFEEVPTLFQRATVTLQDGTKAEAYVMPPDRVAGKPRISAGTWRKNPRPSS